MAWTDERVDVLKKLWGEGLSASQIANQLGEVSRNAVIGKVHRLGLARRAASSRSQVTISRKPRRVPAAAGSNVQFASRDKNARKVLGGAPETWRKNPPMRSKAIDELVIPMAERKTIATLESCSCRWPIGDPEEDDFHFCGRNKLDSGPYCAHHAQVAYQPKQARGGRSKTQARPVAVLSAGPGAATRNTAEPAK